MHTVRKNLYEFMDKFNLDMNLFKIQGITIISFAIIKAIIMVIITFYLDRIASILSLGIFDVPSEFGVLIKYFSSKFVLLIFPFLIFLGFMLYIEIKSGIVAKNNWDKPENSKEVLEWARNYIIYIGFTIFYSIEKKLSFWTFIIVLLNVISAMAFFYFSQRLNASRKTTNQEIF